MKNKRKLRLPVKWGDDLEPLFILQKESLPLHIKSIKIQIPQIDHVNKRPCNRTAALMCCSIVIVIIIISVTVAVTIQQLNDSQQEHLSKLKLIPGNSTFNVKHFARNSTKEATTTKRSDIHQFVPCLKTCRKYSAFRFKSSCIKGKCRCNNPSYNTDTCLPNVGGCAIQKTEPDVNTIASLRYPLYSCRTIGSTSNISVHADRASYISTHVISMYGQSEHSEVKVKLKHSETSRSKDIDIVLANFLKTKWILELPDAIRIRKIYLISSKYLQQSTVEIYNYNKRVSPPVVNLFSRVGYGDDIYNGYTVNLLRTINTEINKITSFSGIKYSPQWQLNV